MVRKGEGEESIPLCTHATPCQMSGRVNSPTLTSGPAYPHLCHQDQLQYAAWGARAAFQVLLLVRDGASSLEHCIHGEARPVIYSPRTFTWSLVAALTSDVTMFSVVWISTPTLLLCSHGLRHGPWQQLGLGPHHGPRWQGCPLTTGYFIPFSSLQFHLSS